MIKVQLSFQHKFTLVSCCGSVFVYMIPQECHTSASLLLVPCRGTEFIYIIQPENVIPVRVYPGCGTKVRISSWYKIFQHHHVNEEEQLILTSQWVVRVQNLFYQSKMDAGRG